MRTIVVAVAALFLAGLTFTGSAQEDTGPWFYAANRDTGEVLAFTPDGTTHSLLSSGVDGLLAGLRMGADGAVLGISVNRQTEVYYLTPTAATKVMAPVPPGKSQTPEKVIQSQGLVSRT